MTPMDPTENDGHELGVKEQINAVVAAVTELLHNDPANRANYLQASAPALRQIPPDNAFHITMHMIHVLLRHIARVENRSVDEVWRDIALIIAEEIPEDDS